MRGETWLYVSDELAGTADDTVCFRGSDFMSMEIASATTTIIHFKSPELYNTKTGDVILTLPTLAAGAGTSNFKEACRAFTGALNYAKGNMLVLADELNGEYVSPFQGAVAVDDQN